MREYATPGSVVQPLRGKDALNSPRRVAVRYGITGGRIHSAPVGQVVKAVGQPLGQPVLALAQDHDIEERLLE